MTEEIIMLTQHTRRLFLTLTFLLGIGVAHAETTLLNVSYDPTREFYDEFNRNFITLW